MIDGRRRDAWDHTAQLLCLLVNLNRGKNDPARKPAEFHPYHRRKKSKTAAPAQKISVAALAALMIDGKIPPELQ